MFYIVLFFFCFIFAFFLICHIYPPFTRKRIALLYFERDDCTRLRVAISKVSGPPVFHIKVFNISNKGVQQKSQGMVSSIEFISIHFKVNKNWP